MSIRRVSLALAFALGLGMSLAAADTPPRSVRVVGETASAVEGVPRRFVLDAVLTDGDAKFHSSVHGWFAGLSAGPDDTDPPHGEISGDCVQSRCAVSVDVDGKLALTVDLAGPAGPSTGRFAFTDGEDKTTEGDVRFTPVQGPVEGLGEIAPPDAITPAELSDLLMWNGFAGGFSNAEPTEMNDMVRDPLAFWQSNARRPGAGLLLTADIADLRAGAAAARKTAGWTVIGDPAQGWTAGYPAALLPQAGPAGPERHFSSADGKASLVIAIAPPLDGAAFDALVEQSTQEVEGREGQSYTRVNDEMELSYTEKGQVYVAAFHRRNGGFARLLFSYPAAQEDRYGQYGTLLQRSLKVGEDLKAP